MSGEEETFLKCLSAQCADEVALIRRRNCAFVVPVEWQRHGVGGGVAAVRAGGGHRVGPHRHKPPPPAASHTGRKAGQY